jgi:hypothetical protein
MTRFLAARIPVYCPYKVVFQRQFGQKTKSNIVSDLRAGQLGTELLAMDLQSSPVPRGLWIQNGAKNVEATLWIFILKAGLEHTCRWERDDCPFFQIDAILDV